MMAISLKERFRCKARIWLRRRLRARWAWLSRKDPVILPLRYVVKVVDAKTNAAVDATVKLVTTPDNAPIIATPSRAWRL